MTFRQSTQAFLLTTLIAAIPVAFAQSRAPKGGRLVLVELYTSQGCNMCPEAEKNLGTIGDSNSSVAPLALHVDYFDRPWKDPFSDKLHSERQMSYHNTYKGRKDPDLGLYYTPMMMVDGLTTVNGRDPVTLKAAVAAARKKPPGASIDAKFEKAEGGRKGKLNLTIEPRSAKLSAGDQLVCAVLRDDSVATDVKSGENSGKTLTNRFPARKMVFETAKFENRTAKPFEFEFEMDPAWNTSKLSIVVFVQDMKTGEVHQSAVVPVAPER